MEESRTTQHKKVAQGDGTEYVNGENNIYY